MSACLVCDAAVEPFLSFGPMPIANGFLTPAQFADEYFFELATGFCEACNMVQLTEIVDRERMFHENYAFFSSTSSRMGEHFRRMAASLRERIAYSADPFVVEIGSNDGIMLQHFAADGIRHLGVEPSANVAAVAREKGIRTVSQFFDATLAREIVAEHGHADCITGANVLCHIPYLHSVLEGMKILLGPRGVVVTEDPYLGDILEKTSYDQIYDEHAFYFSVLSISRVFATHGLELIDVEPQEVHGGSMRYTFAHAGAYPVSQAVARQRELEEEAGLRQRATYDRFRANVERSRDALTELLQRVRRDGKRVVGYAATSKSTTVLNYCGITSDLVEFISDTTPLKQGKLSPGMHIPVRPHSEFAARYPDYALLFGWDHAAEVFAKEKEFREAGGKWITYVPDVRVIE
jgi:methylation protein EvaC